MTGDPGVTTVPVPFLARLERFGRVASTNDVVREWLARGEREVCVAVADEQTAGRGRHGRTWTAPRDAALLCSVGFRPTWLEPDRAWRLAAVVSLAMADAAEDVAGLPEGTIGLKWPNDLVVVMGGDGASVLGEVDAAAARARREGELDARKLGGVLGETAGLGTPGALAIVGIGVNADWAAEDFPPALRATMTSLREVSGGRPIDRDALLAGFLDRLETQVEALRAGWFDVAAWTARQVVAGRTIRLESPSGEVSAVRALAVDASTGALIVADETAAGGERAVLAGEIVHARLAAEV